VRTPCTVCMPQVEIPEEIHGKVQEYAENHGYTVERAYVELVEFALRETERDEDDDLQSGIA
jgi:hypothetical protein